MVLGQSKLEQALLTMLQHGNFGHAVFFSGYDESANNLIAEWFGKMLVCQDLKTNEPCGSCRACQSLIRNDGTLFKILDSGNSNYTVDEIRGLKRDLALTNPQNSNRVVLIKRAQNLREASANALLKVLEEPAAKIFFILTSINPSSVLKTINSRVVHFVIQPVPRRVSKEKLTELGFSKTEIDLALELFPGQLERAKDFLEGKENFENFQELHDHARRLLAADLLKRMKISGQILQKLDTSEQRSRIQEMFRLLLIKMKNQPEYWQILPKFLQAHWFLKTNANPKQIFESILMQLP